MLCEEAEHSALLQKLEPTERGGKFGALLIRSTVVVNVVSVFLQG